MRAATLIRPLAVAALVGLAGCVGAPVGQPVGYAPPPYGAPPAPLPPAAYAQPGYNQPGYAQQGYPQPGASQVAYGGTCYAGPYTCAMDQQAPVGSQCSCPGLGAPSYGTVR